MSGPHSDDLFGMSQDEVDRLIARLRPEPLDPPRRGFGIHHEPPLHFDDDEGVGAEDGED